MTKISASIRTAVGAAMVLSVGLATGSGPGLLAPGEASAAETAAGAALVPSGAPLRRQGWWEFRSGRETSGPSDEQLCVGARSETVFSSFDQLAPPDWCATRDFHREGSGWSFSTTCDYGAGPVTIAGTITGDLTSDYLIHETVSSKRTGTREGYLTARWAGTCPAGKKDGDRVIDGYEINVLEPPAFSR